MRQRLGIQHLALGVLLLGAPLLQAEVPAGGTCSGACYAAKSAAYQRCRTEHPPAERGARSACFQQADDALARCLKACLK